MIALKPPKAKKWSAHGTISLKAHTTKLAGRILRKGVENKIEYVPGEDQVGFRKENEIGLQFGC